MDPKDVSALKSQLRGLELDELLSWAARTFPGRVALASSLGAEDQVLLDIAARGGLLAGEQPLELFTLDTGRLFPETLTLLAESEARYNTRFRVYYPNTPAVEAMVFDAGIDLFRRSVEERHRCCHVRKVEPLQRALANKDLWIVGLRNAQNTNRSGLEPISWDAANGLLKLCPLLDWSEAQVFGYLDEHSVPRNPLHTQGYPSIGCAPCTRAVAEGEDPRAGRWWWEQESHRECGLHFDQGRLVRSR